MNPPTLIPRRRFLAASVAARGVAPMDQQDFIDCVRSRKLAVAHAEAAHPRLGARLKA